MKIPQTQVVSFAQAHILVDQAAEKGWGIRFLAEKNQLLIENEGGWLIKLFLPWTLSWSP